MKIFKSLEFTFGGNLLWFESDLVLMTINEKNLAKIRIKNNNKENYEYQLDEQQIKSFENFAYYSNKRLLYPLETDVFHPTIIKTTKFGKKYFAEYNPEDIKPLLQRFVDKDLLKRIYKNEHP